MSIFPAAYERIILADVMKKVTIDPSRYLKGSGYYDKDGKEMILQPEMDYPNYPDNCWTIDVAKHPNMTPNYVVLAFKPFSSAEIFVEDRLLSLKRASSLTKFSSTGPQIAVENGQYGGFALEIEQEIFDERDEAFGCKNYPTELYLTYQDCDQDHLRKMIAREVSNIMPFWASKNLNDTTALPTLPAQNFSENFIFGKMIVGTQRTECPLPCTTTKISVRYIS